MNGKILWADDEIELLKPHILFLKDKGYEITQSKSGDEAIEQAQETHFDIVFLDENMPGLSGLETLVKIKAIQPDVPIVMITKSEEEFLMDDAIGSQISDYLIKPVNPKQILLSIKKLLENKRLVSEKVTTQYQQDFAQLSMRVNENLDAEEWIDVYKKIVHWDMELSKSAAEGMRFVLDTQKTEANGNFARFVEKNYFNWIRNPNMTQTPVLSHTLLNKKVLPLLDNDLPVYFILIDNLRYDHWKALQPRFAELFRIQEDSAYFSILPTATNYSRNAIFAGLTPAEIQKKFPNKWYNDEEEGGKNQFEEDFIKDYLQRAKKDIKFSYNKITNMDAGRTLLENINNLQNYKLNVIVYNFVDLLSHVRTEMEVIKELAEDEGAYRSLVRTWFDHSPLYEILKKISDKKANVVVSTDHGSVLVKKPSRIVGDRDTTTNLRYKNGKNLNYQAKEVFAVAKPEDAGLPRPHVSTSYVFAKEDFFFVYPNNYNHYVNMYKNTFQHGGLSLEEMIIPVITMQTKG
ncbi:MAG: T9SS response regulator signal transducer PorX [Bacteroidia bacterium]